MKIAVLNGNPTPARFKLDEYLRDLCGKLESRGHAVKRLTLREMDLRYCRGCFDCWVKTPGQCPIQDEAEAVCRSVIGAELVIFASPVIMGFVSATLKRAMDRMIPLLNPYLEIVNGEFHHPLRYGISPKLALLLERGEDTDEGDIGIISDVFSRTALNLRTIMCFVRTTAVAAEEVASEIDRI